MDDRVQVIAEAGVNHNGSLALALEMVDVAASSGVDAVKFQTFVPEAIASLHAPRAPYQVRRSGGGSETQREMLSRLALGPDEFAQIKQHCADLDLEFLSTPFDANSADLLADIGVSRFKISSGDLTNLPLLRHVAKKRRPLIISTGMGSLGEVEQALEVVLREGVDDITLLHCTSSYPTPYCDVNLCVMETLRRAFGFRVGYSDHTLGIGVAAAAVALGARMIEKHFTLDRSFEGPDHRASIIPTELSDLVASIRAVEEALGDGRKRLTDSERANVVAVRRSLVASTDIPVGQLITERCLMMKRPGSGIPASFLDIVVGRRARVHIPADTVLTWEMI